MAEFELNGALVAVQVALASEGQTQVICLGGPATGARELDHVQSPLICDFFAVDRVFFHPGR